MTIGVVTSFEYNDTEYELPISKEQRQQFADDLQHELVAIDGVEEAYNSGATQSWDSIYLEVTLTTTESGGVTELTHDPRSLSPQIRDTIESFVPVSSFDVTSTPTPVNADANIYDETFYGVEVWFY